MGNAKKEVEKINWNPLDSPVGRIGVNLLTGGVPEGIKRSNEFDAMERRAADNVTQDQARQDEAYAQQQGIVNQNNQLEQKRLADEKRNKEYQDQQAGISKSIADEDAFTRARNAARREKGNTLFGAWG